VPGDAGDCAYRPILDLANATRAVTLLAPRHKRCGGDRFLAEIWTMHNLAIPRHVGHLLLAMLVAVVAGALPAAAEIRSEPIEYRDGPTLLRGYLAYDDATQDPRPAVLVAPEWWGTNSYPQHRAQMLARMGYVAFAIDMYGKGKVTDDPRQAGDWATPFRNDRALMRQRAMAGLNTLLAQKYVDANRVAAIGYCFGGTVVLELARSGAPLVGVISFHGDLSRVAAEGPDTIRSKVLICAGVDDPYAPPAVLNSFQEEMKLAKADFQLNLYSGAEHAFTNPAADSHHLPGIAYNAQADKRSWMALNDFFAEVFHQQ
jgi:dienelactone hydrolase